MKISTKCSALVRLGDEFSSLSPFLPSLLPSGMNELHQQELLFWNTRNQNCAGSGLGSGLVLVLVQMNPAGTRTRAQTMARTMVFCEVLHVTGPNPQVKYCTVVQLLHLEQNTHNISE